MNKKEYEFKTQKELRSWLSKNYSQKEGIWVVYHKKGYGGTFGQSEICDECLCYGWIDSLVNKVDATKTKLYIAPRKPNSNWSKVNKDKVEKLLKENRIEENGLRVIKLSKQNGKWNALHDVENLTIPKDLAEAFTQEKESLENWNNFSRSIKRGILEWILNAKKENTRKARIEKTVKLAKENIPVNQYKK